MATGLGAVITSHPFQRSYTQQPHRSSQHLPRTLIQIHFALAFSRSSSPFTITTSHALEIACASRNATPLGSCVFSATLITLIRVSMCQGGMQFPAHALCERGCIDFGGRRQGHEVWIFPSNGSKSDVCVLEVWAVSPSKDFIRSQLNV